MQLFDPASQPRIGSTFKYLCALHPTTSTLGDFLRAPGKNQFHRKIFLDSTYLRPNTGFYSGAICDMRQQPQADMAYQHPDSTHDKERKNPVACWKLSYNSHGLIWFINTQTQPTTKHESNSVTY